MERGNFLTIYLDVIWLLNFFFDSFLLFLTAIILKRKVKKWRIFLGALIGSSIVLFYFTAYGAMTSHPVVKLLYSILIVYAAFGFLKFRYFIKNLVTFYFITFMVGGGMLGLHYFFRTDIAFINGTLTSQSSGFGDPVSWITVLIGFPLVWYFSKHNMEEIEMTKINFEQLVSVRVKIGEDYMYLKGLIDSGNQLYDPITQTPVMILETVKAASCFPASLIQQSQNPEMLDFSTIDPIWANRIRIVPYRAVGQDHQFLLAIRPDHVVIINNEKEITVKKVLIGLSNTILSSNGEYECIIHPKMLTNTNISA
jgi:stage II sporulation protein GA (sporulation sigma-E factor processing peptidase)